MAKEVEFYLQKLAPMIAEYYRENGKPDQTDIFPYRSPDQLQQVIDFHLNEEGFGSTDSQEKVLELCKQTLEYSTRSAHPRNFKQLYSGTSPLG